MKSMTTALREMLNSDQLMICPCVYDALSAKMVERAGFNMVGVGGNALGAALGIGEPLLCLEDLVRVCRYIASFVKIPLKVDAGAGFGEPLHVMRTIRELESAGVAAVHIEDQIYPKRAHYHKGIEHIIPAEEMLEKIKAAIEARRDKDFIIIGRTDAMRTDGFAEAVRRANLYLETGADMVYVFPNNEREARQAPKEINGPLVCPVSDGNRMGRPHFSLSELQEMGYKMVAYPSSCIQVAVKAVKTVLETLKETGRTGLDQTEFINIRKYIEDSLGLEEMYKLEKETVEK